MIGSKARWAGVLGALLLVSSVSLRAQDEQLSGFVARARDHLPPDFVDGPDFRLLKGYTWRWTETLNEVDPGGKVRKSVRVRLIVAEREDGEAVVGIREFDDDGKLEGEVARPARVAFQRCCPDRGQGLLEICGRARALIWSMLNLSFSGEETIADVPVYAFHFRTPDESSKQRLEALETLRKKLLKLQGTLWFDKKSGQLVRAEGEYRGDVYLGWGVYSSRKGESWSWQLRRTSSGDWVPSRWVRRTRLQGVFKKTRRERIGLLSDLRAMTLPSVVPSP